MAASADIVFLVDKTRSMQRVLGALAEGVGTALTTLANPPRQDVPVVTDWRAKVIGYGDVRHDGEKWWKEAPFRVADVAQVKADLAALLPAAGGGDDPESLLDALYKVFTMESTSPGAVPDANKWRSGRLHKVVFVFSDAPTHEVCHLPEANGKTFMDVGDLQGQHKVCMYVPYDPTNAMFENWSRCVIDYLGVYGEGTDADVRAMEAWASQMAEFHEWFGFHTGQISTS